MAGEIIITPKIFLAVVLIVALGYGVVHAVANRKWGYTPKREKELDKKL